MVLTFGLICRWERGDANMAALLYFENIIYQVHFSRPIWNLKPSFITIWSQDYTIALEPNAFKSYFFVKSKLECNAWLCLVEYLPGRVPEINKPQHWNKMIHIYIFMYQFWWFFPPKNWYKKTNQKKNQLAGSTYIVYNLPETRNLDARLGHCFHFTLYFLL